MGFLVGLTGMGGGSLMTPILVVFFGIQPLAAISSDLVVSLLMKPVGAAVHLRRGTVHKSLVLWLMTGSVPAAFAGVLILRTMGNGPSMQAHIKFALGCTLLVAASTIVARGLLQAKRKPASTFSAFPVRRLSTIAIGVFGGLVVGMTSVGSGSLIIVGLLLLYPRLTGNDLVGTDLVQAVPLVASAALGHILFGDFQLALTTSLVLGAIPGAYLGARYCVQAPENVVRSVVSIVLIASGMKLLDVPNTLVVATVVILTTLFILKSRRVRNNMPTIDIRDSAPTPAEISS